MLKILTSQINNFLPNDGKEPSDRMYYHFEQMHLVPMRYFKFLTAHWGMISILLLMIGYPFEINTIALSFPMALLFMCFTLTSISSTWNAKIAALEIFFIVWWVAGNYLLS